MQKAVEAYFQLLKLIMVLCLAGMVILVFGNVVLRYGFNSGITIADEVSRLFFVFLTFLGAIVTMREHAHLGVDTLVKRLPVLGKKFCFVVSHVLMLFATWMFLQGSWMQAEINMSVKSPVSGYSMGLFYGVGVLFGISVGAILLADLYRVLSGKASEDELVAVKESEESAEIERVEAERNMGGQAGELKAAKPI